MKEKEPRQTVCNEPGTTPKQAFCGGKLKSITTLEPDLAQSVDKGLDLLRCQLCGTLYTETSPYVATRK